MGTLYFITDKYEAKKTWRRPTLPHSYPCSTIGAGELNFCVRDGNRCFLPAMITRLIFKTNIRPKPLDSKKEK
jgi:hypothetical protein